MASELTIEAVRDFIVLNDGKVKNNVLVAHFKKFLNDPQKKVNARQKFKDHVNTVAVVKTEHGEKYVQLKKKYRTAAPIISTDLSPPESTSETNTDASPNHISSFDNPIVPENEKRGKDEGHSAPTSTLEDQSNRFAHTDVIDEDDDGDSSVLSFGPPISIHPPEQVDPMLSTPKKQDPVNTNSEPSTSLDPSGVFRVPLPPGPGERKPAITDTPHRSSQPHQIPHGAVDQARLNFQVGNDDNTSIMQSEASLESKENDFEDERGGGSFAMDPLEKQWMMMSVEGNMVELRKLLNKDPNLAEKRDFVFGYTSLHWACKKGNIDLVRMLADTGIDVNVKSNGGYTPMHLAAMHSHEKVVQILVEEFEADGNIRNYSGKQPRDYLRSGSISLPIQKLLFGNDGHGSVKSFAAGLRPRLDSVRKSKRLGNAISGGVGVLGALVRNSTSSEDVSILSSASPSVGRKGSFISKGKKKRKWSKGERPSISIVSSNSDEIEAGFMLPRTTSSAHKEMHRGHSSSSLNTPSRPVSSRSGGKYENGEGDR